MVRVAAGRESKKRTSAPLRRRGAIGVRTAPQKAAERLSLGFGAEDTGGKFEAGNNPIGGVIPTSVLWHGELTYLLPDHNRRRGRAPASPTEQNHRPDGPSATPEGSA